MEFYGRNDITLGGFLEIYCFRYIGMCFECKLEVTIHSIVKQVSQNVVTCKKDRQMFCFMYILLPVPKETIREKQMLQVQHLCILKIKIASLRDPGIQSIAKLVKVVAPNCFR